MVEINSNLFLITAADEYVFDLMERPEMVEKYPKSNLRMILNKISASAGHKFKQMMAR